MAGKSSSVRKTIKGDRQVAADKKRTTLGGSQLIEHIRQLAWTGQHAAAIDSATRALASPKIKPTEQMSCQRQLEMDMATIRNAHGMGCWECGGG